MLFGLQTLYRITILMNKDKDTRLQPDSVIPPQALLEVSFQLGSGNFSTDAVTSQMKAWPSIRASR